PAPSVDTGAGLERLAAVLQGVKSNYETDLITPIIGFIADLAGKKYTAESDDGFAMRVIADHARATAFSIADGIVPGNVGRNYVLRKIMRRAIYHGAKQLGLHPPFFQKVTQFVTDLMGEPYPELIGARPAIEQTVREEEHRFNRILGVGEPRLVELFKRFEPSAPPMPELVKTYDTYGVPRDLIRVVLGQHGFEMAEEEFNAQFDTALKTIQQESAPPVAAAARKTREIYGAVTKPLAPTDFTGYQETTTPAAKVLAIVTGEEQRDAIAEGQTAEVLLDRTPFYAEAGGQIGDTGLFETDAMLAVVEDTYAPVTGYNFHKVAVERGILRVGDILTARVDAERRRRIKANHTGTHLLHAALREVLGPHVKQAGSLVAPDRLRFDFTHYAALTEDDVAEIERLVNEEVLHNRSVVTEVKQLDEALKSGAMALFGEKYATNVRVVSVPGFSTELCGGTHVHATGDIGPLKIVSDSSIAAGVRRIEALTADGAIERFQTDEQVIKKLTEQLKAQPVDLPVQIDKLQEQVRRYEREIEQLKMKLALGQSGAAEEEVREVAGIKVLSRRVSDLDPNGLRQLADALSQRVRSGVVVLGQTTDGKASLVVRVTDDLTSRLNAGQIVREIATLIGGKGGGRADMATGGGNEPEKLDQALGASFETVERLMQASK
ncbi:MAG TPA: alanine--tRNA ligase, partial [Blastocatellia bacterium]|nr:alanine--tRNA ligase [Blastocatellia bacterium]